MLHSKSQKEIGFIVFSFICMSVLTLVVTQAIQQKEELKAEKKELEEEKLKLDSDLTDKVTEIRVLDDSLAEQEELVKKLERDKKKLNNSIKKSDKTIKKKDKEIKGLKQLSSKKKKNETTPELSTSGKTLSMEITAYTAFCDTGCIGITATGTNVKNTIYHPTGHRVVAVDPSVVPLGTIMEIEGETYIADDTGGDIKGNRLDILVDSKTSAMTFGRQRIQVKILE